MQFLAPIVQGKIKTLLEGKPQPARFTQALAKNQPQDQKLHPLHPPVTTSQSFSFKRRFPQEAK